MGKNKRNEKKFTNKSKQLIKDFEKKKRKKLGAKLKPANSTEISFRSHSIHVTKQSLKDQNRELRKTVALISFDIKESLINLSHHKGKVRRDVLIELKSILSRIEDDTATFRNILHENLVFIVSIFELVYDHESLVRNALRVFMNWLMPRIGTQYIELFGPFWHQILAHLMAALSHINMEIRYNALKILRSFFSVSSVAKYFNIKQSLSLLSHLHLLFTDIIRSGHFILNHDDIKMITSLSKNNRQNTQNSNTQKVKKIKTNHQETLIIVHILCECSIHIIKVIQTQMHDSHDAMENNLHSLLLPNDNKIHHNKMQIDDDNDDDDDIDFNMMNNDNMCLLKSLLSIFTSCCLIFEQFGKKRKYSAMSMVLTLCGIISDCLSDHTLKELMSDYLKYQQKQLEKRKKTHKLNKKRRKIAKFKINDLRLFISKSLMSLFNVFPIEFIEEIESDHDDNDDDNDDDNKNENENENENDDDTKMEKKNEEKLNKQEMGKLNVMRMNIKTIEISYKFHEYWNLNLLQQENQDNKTNNKRKLDYFKQSYEWLNNSLIDVGSNHDGNTKIMIDLLQILKKLIRFYDETKQLQLLLCVDQLLNNSAFIDHAKTIFNQFVN